MWTLIGNPAESVNAGFFQTSQPHPASKIEQKKLFFALQNLI